MSIKHLIVSLIAIVLVSCSDDYSAPASCDDCYFVEPTEHNASFYFSLSDDNPTVEFAIYQSDKPEGVPFYEGVADSSEVEIWLPLGYRYTAVANYCRDARPVSVIDGGRMYVKFSRTLCEEECYMIYGKTFDLRLRF